MIKKYSAYRPFNKKVPGNTGTLSVSVDGYNVYATLNVKILNDPNYGANADGNFGMPMTEIEDWEFAEEPLVSSEDSEEYIPYKSLPQEVQKQIVSTIDKNIMEIDLDEEEPQDSRPESMNDF